MKCLLATFVAMLSLPSALAQQAGPILNNSLTGGAPAQTAQTITPQGRLTLTTATPVMTADATAQTTVYYDCYVGNTVPVAGTNLTISSCEVAMGLDAVTPHVASGSVYDIFGVNNSGALATCVGPAWSSTTSRGSGAGTTEIHLDSHGLWTNANSLTHCYGGASGTTDYGTTAANNGTYLGSLYGTANGQTGMQFSPTPASGGTNNVLALYNAYNRVSVRSTSQDSHADWTYATSTWRPADNSTSNRINWLDGLKQSPVLASYVVTTYCSASCASIVIVGVNFDSTSAVPTGPALIATNVSSQHTPTGAGSSTVLLGWHYAQAMEDGLGGTTAFETSLRNGLSITVDN